jgi:hypothetical protein
VPITLQQPVAAVANAGTAALTITPGSAFTAGNGVVVGIGSSTRAPTSVVDSNAVALTFVRSNNFFGAPFATIYYLPTVTGSPTSVTINFASSTEVEAAVYEVVGTIGLNAGSGTNANGSNSAPGAFTTTVANTFAVSVLKDNVISAAPAGYTLDLNNTSCGVASIVYTSIQTGINPAWTNTGGGYGISTEAFTSTVTSVEYWVPCWLRRQGLPVPAEFNPLTNALRLAPALLSQGVAAAAYFPTAMKSFSFPTPTTRPGDVRQPLLFGLTPSPLPPGPGHGDHTPFIRRLPAGTSQDDKRRLERVHDQLSSLLNSLIGQGVAVQLSPERWTWRGGARVETRYPTAVDDASQGVVVGALWVCSVDRAKFICVDNTQNAAVWDAL